MGHEAESRRVRSSRAYRGDARVAFPSRARTNRLRAQAVEAVRRAQSATFADDVFRSPRGFGRSRALVASIRGGRVVRGKGRAERARVHLRGRESQPDRPGGRPDARRDAIDEVLFLVQEIKKNTAKRRRARLDPSPLHVFGVEVRSEKPSRTRENTPNQVYSNRRPPRRGHRRVRRRERTSRPRRRRPLW